MSRLEEIENAADQLSAEEKQELLLFLASRLRAPDRTLPPPREFSREQLAAWIAEDKEGYRRFREPA
jgi:dsDNA-binding SOS-regulon protein